MVTADNDIATIVIGFVHAFSGLSSLLPLMPLDTVIGAVCRVKRRWGTKEEKKTNETAQVERVNGFEYANCLDSIGGDGGTEGGRRSFIPNCYRFSRSQPRVTKHSLPRSSSKVRDRPIYSTILGPGIPRAGIVISGEFFAGYPGQI